MSRFAVARVEDAPVNARITWARNKYGPIREMAAALNSGEIDPGALEWIRRGLVPQTPAGRWRAVQADGAVLTRWCSQVEAMRFASKASCTVEEYTKPIGDKAERSAERVAAFAADQERRTRRG